MLITLMVLGIFSLSIQPERTAPIFEQVLTVNVEEKLWSSYILSDEKIPGIRGKGIF